jgi:hypothetical protein
MSFALQSCEKEKWLMHKNALAIISILKGLNFIKKAFSSFLRQNP